jgi:hypothetical protein
MPRAPKSEDAAARATRLESCFGLSDPQINLADNLPGGELAFLVSMAQHDGVACARRVGRELGRLQNLGFVEIRKNGKGAIAKLTLDGYRALIFRLRPH